jgi:hypothetical protein
MDRLLSSYRRKARNNEVGFSKDNKASSHREMLYKNTNAENTIQNICLLDSQIMMLRAMIAQLV